MRRLLGAAFMIAGLSGVAVAFAGLFTDLSTAPVEPRDVRAENSGSGSDLFAAPHSYSVDDSREVAQVKDTSADYTPSSLSVNYPMSDGYSDSMGLSSAVANSTALLRNLYKSLNSLTTKRISCRLTPIGLMELAIIILKFNLCGLFQHPADDQKQH